MDVISARGAVRTHSRLAPSALASVAVGGLLFYSWFWASLALVIGGLAALPALGTGLLLLIPWLLLMQLAVRIERRRAVAIHGIPVILPPRRHSRRTGFSGWLSNRWFELGTWAFWRGALHHHLAILVAGVFFTASAVFLWFGWTGWEAALTLGTVEVGGLELSRWTLGGIGTAGLVLAVVMLGLGALADRGLARGLISGSEDDLREQVAELAERRQGAVDAAAQERLRIERDLHDGVQPRLVNLAMTLGIAKNTVRTDPERAELLVGEAHAEAKAVMTDLRQLARGIHPAVLTDRGLDAALSALAARSQVPVALQVELGAESMPALGRELEAVAYFVVAEALTNIAKHAEATAAEVSVHQDDSVLRVRIQDDGRGGAQVRRDGFSTGLAGLTDRVRATGGLLEVASPPGGGTALTAVIPLAGRTAPAPGRSHPTTQQLSHPTTLEDLR